MLDQALIAKVAALSTADRLELIAAVWDMLPHQSLPVTEAEKKLLDSRLADAEANPSDEAPWQEVKSRLERKLT